jgi:hypothetical protein
MVTPTNFIRRFISSSVAALSPYIQLKLISNNFNRGKQHTTSIIYASLVWQEIEELVKKSLKGISG